MNKNIPLIIFIMLICFSCKEGETYYRFKDIKLSEWYGSDTLKFEIDSTCIDVNTRYDITIEVMNNTEYLYQNLWLYINSDLASKGLVVEQKEYMLADSLGKWYGPGFGSTYQLSLPLKKGISFSEKRNYTVNIVHGMTDEPLKGLEKIGLKIKLAEE